MSAPTADRQPSSIESAASTALLRTERLTIRPFESGDLADLVALHNDPAVMRYLNNGRPVPRADVADELASWIESYGRRDGYGLWATTATDSGGFVGWFHFRPGEGADDREPELGYRLRREYWGIGLATEGSRALIDRGFHTLSIRRVYAHTMSIHRASRRVLEKSGLRLVRTFNANWPVRIPGDEYGDVEYELTREQWEADRATFAPPS